MNFLVKINHLVRLMCVWHRTVWTNALNTITVHTLGQYMYALPTGDKDVFQGGGRVTNRLKSGDLKGTVSREGVFN
jgi:hypothetical protein